MDTQLLQSVKDVLPLIFGIPVLLKDNIDTKEGMPNTAGAEQWQNQGLIVMRS